MTRFDRYLLRQLLLAFGFSALILVLVFWINRAVLLFDRLIANGESARVFLELSMLTLPLMVAIVLPIAGFVAALLVTNRLSGENELVVAQSAGLSPWRMARPVLYFGLLVSLFLLALGHVLVPLSQDRLAQRQAQISQNISARFLTEGSFVHPAPGITIYIREITRDGELRDIFLADSRDRRIDLTYTAKSALLLRSEDGPRLVMFEGLAQALERESARMTITAFTDFTYNLSALVGGEFPVARKLPNLASAELLRAAPAVLAETGAERAAFRREFHERNARALIAPVGALIGFSALLLGGFSRFGLWRQIFTAIIVLGLVKVLDNAMIALAAGNPALIWGVYLAPLLGLGLGAGMLWLAPRQGLPGRRRRTGAGAGGAAGREAGA